MRERLLLLLCLCLPVMAHAQAIIARNEPVYEHHEFDPANPPAEMPRLTPGENAVTQSYFGADARVGGQVFQTRQVNGEFEVSIKVDMVRMTLQMRAHIWVPKNTTPKLTNHEEGHRLIAERFYANAETLARPLADGLLGQILIVRGPDPQMAADQALREAAQSLGAKYLALTDEPCAKVQREYDRITAHGTNAVKEDAAIEQAMKIVSPIATTRK